MQKIFTFLVLLAGSISVALGQNMVPNCSFESYTACPTFSAQVPNATGWISYTAGSPDYFNACHFGGVVGVPANFVGNQAAAHGNGYMGFLTHYTGNYREYVGTTLSTPMTVGVMYEISMSLSLADVCAIASDNIGVRFLKNAPTSVAGTGPLGIPPHVDYNSLGTITDQTNWVRVSKYFVADSSYDRFVIGNFYNNASTSTVTVPFGGTQSYAYYYLDSIVIRQASPIFFTMPDTTICRGDTISIPYTVTNPGYFTAGNVFTLQLSNSSGSFATFTNLATRASTTSGTIKGIIPSTITPGPGYKLRIVATTPADTSRVMSADLRLKQKPGTAFATYPHVCDGFTMNLSGSASLAGTAFSWAGPASFTSTLQNPSRSPATLAMTGSYIVTGTLDGCSDSDTAYIEVYPIPTAPAASSNSPVCTNGQINLNATSASTGAIYIWTGPAFSFSGQNTVRNNATIAMSGAYGVKVIVNGCSSPTTTVNVTVQPATPMPVASANTPLCVGENLNLQASTVPNATYKWSGPKGYTSTSRNNILPGVAFPNGGKYTVTATLNNCESEADTIDVVVNTQPLVGAYISPGDTICLGATATYVAFPQTPGIVPSYQWYKNYVPVAGANALIYATTGLVTGDKVYCAMTANNVCNVPITVSTDTFEMIVLPIVTVPSVEITADPGLHVRPADKIKFTAVVKNGGTTPKYQWYKNGVILPGARYATLELYGLSYMDMIHVDIISEDPCAQQKNASDTVWMQFPAGMSDVNSSNLKLYPNPNKGDFVITGIPFDATDVEISNALGQVVYQKHIPVVNGSVRLETTLSKGMYIIRIGHAALRFTVLE
ncbi:MAG: T9SS type A sorting domain-containing protein [Sphingobacteriales bacterium]|nr:MAG: T9SS type A sorting domain-containing protein [Sphingobacteriales bacterium]